MKETHTQLKRAHEWRDLKVKDFLKYKARKKTITGPKRWLVKDFNEEGRQLGAWWMRWKNCEVLTEKPFGSYESRRTAIKKE